MLATRVSALATGSVLSSERRRMRLAMHPIKGGVTSRTRPCAPTTRALIKCVGRPGLDEVIDHRVSSCSVQYQNRGITSVLVELRNPVDLLRHPIFFKFNAGKQTLYNTSMQRASETCVGSIDRVTFHNADNGFPIRKSTVNGHNDLLTLVGHLVFAIPGKYVEDNGRWALDRDHVQQFQEDSILTTSRQASLDWIKI